jgi:hypothetical protein
MVLLQEILMFFSSMDCDFTAAVISGSKQAGAGATGRSVAR